MAEFDSHLAGPTASPSEERRALAVARGICRLFARNDTWCLAEMPLRCGRRADTSDLRRHAAKRAEVLTSRRNRG